MYILWPSLVHDSSQKYVVCISICCKESPVLNITEELSDVEPEDSVREDRKTVWVAD